MPRWRGAAPIQRAIMEGDPTTGVQVMQMEAGLDTGPILLSETVPISDTDTAATLGERLSHIGADLLPRALAALDRGGIAPRTQSEDGVTYAHKIDKAEAAIDWTRPADELDRQIRGLSPFPGAWTMVGDTRVKCLMSCLAKGQGPAGELLDDQLTVACGSGAIRLLTLQRAGKGAQDADIFLRGFPLAKGQQL